MEKNKIPRVSTSDVKRNRIERMRQNGIDDEIQKLMCFLPEREGRAQKLSRNQILMELLGIARKMTENDAKPLKEAESTPKEKGEPSTSG